MLSVILPTYNEAPNIGAVVDGIVRILKDMPFEIIVVDDDSPDDTWKEAEALCSRYKEISVIRRIGEKGLSSAVIRGFSQARGNVLAVMDSDGQHDSALLPILYKEVMTGHADIAIGSRYSKGGSVQGWSRKRLFLSRLATRIALVLFRIRVADPMSGYFAIRRSLADNIIPQLAPRGFKILFDILVHCPVHTVVTEVPLAFGKRMHGESKLDHRVKWQFLASLYYASVFGRILSFPALLFLLLSVIIAVPLGMQSLRLMPLYLGSGVRTQVQQELRDITDRQGWLLSDVSLRSVGRDSMEFLHVPHGALQGISHCYHLSLSDHRLSPCAAAR